MPVTYRLIPPTELNAPLLQRWREIQGSSAAYSSPYFCPEFTLAVAQVRRDVRIAVIEDDNGKVSGFFPHQRSWLGRGRPVGGPFSDYHGVIVEPQCRWDLKALLRAARLSVWTFDHLVGDTTKFEPYARAVASSPQIDLSQGYEKFEQGRRQAGSDFTRKTLGLARKLEREVGPLRFVFHEPGALDPLIAWKSAQYRQAHPAGRDLVFTNDWTIGLLRRIVDVQNADFAGVCSALYAGDRLLAAHMGMRSRSDLHYWFPAYEPQYSKYSTGSILLLRLAEAAAAQGIHTIDLGKGDSQYKRTLMTGAASLMEGAVELPSLLSFVRGVTRAAEARESEGGALGKTLSVPLRLVRRIDRSRRFV